MKLGEEDIGLKMGSGNEVNRKTEASRQDLEMKLREGDMARLEDEMQNWLSCHSGSHKPQGSQLFGLKEWNGCCPGQAWSKFYQGV